MTELMNQFAATNPTNPTESIDMRLIEAVQFNLNDDTTRVAQLIADGANPNAVDDDGDTPLNYACVEGDDSRAVITLLLEKGADPNMASGEDRDTPLGHVALNASANLVKILIDYGANISMDNGYGHNPLGLSVIGDRIENTTLLLAKGADINSANKYGDTPLILAAQYGRPAIAAFLLAEGADVNKGNKYVSALTIAVLNHHHKVAEILLDNGADVGYLHKQESPSLTLAAETDDVDMVSLLIAKGADVFAEDDMNGFTALRQALDDGNLKNLRACKILITEMCRLGVPPAVTAPVAASTPRALKKKCQTTSADSKGTILPSVLISDELATFLGKPSGTKLPKVEVLREIHCYINTHDLHDLINRRTIVPDAALAKLIKLGGEDKLTPFNLLRCLSHHFPPKKNVKAK
jgi:ankyrin repeat protein